MFQAAQSLRAQAQINSWMWALGLGMGLATILPSLYYKNRWSAWSTPGAALIATSATGVAGLTMAQAIGAFVVCAVLIVVAGATRLFRAADEPYSGGDCLGDAGGRVLRFGIEAFVGVKRRR